VSENYHLANKKNLFLNLKKYYIAQGKDPYKFIPVTYLIRHGAKDPTFNIFLEETRSIKNPIWIIKPGVNSNRGRGIKV
jgi:tubulin--tyrosine ligase